MYIERDERVDNFLNPGISRTKNRLSIFYLVLPVIKQKTRDQMQYRQEILEFEMMEIVSLKQYIWYYLVHNVKFQSLEKTHLKMNHHRRNIKRLVKVVPHLKSAYRGHWVIL